MDYNSKIKLLYETLNGQKNKGMRWPLVCGIDTYDDVHSIDLHDCNLFLGGCPGSGMASFLQTMSASILMTMDPTDYQLCVIDTMKATFHHLNLLPSSFHFITTYNSYKPVITKPNTALDVIDSLVDESNQRTAILQKSGFETWMKYKAHISQERDKDIILIIYNYGDLTNSEKYEIVSRKVSTLIDNGTKVGIHIIVAIDSNIQDSIDNRLINKFPVRLIFRTRNADESKIILEEYGAESLSGCGDMIFFANRERLRLKAPYIEYSDIVKLCADINT